MNIVDETHIVAIADEDLAELIAAAPELKEALERVLDWLEDSSVFLTNHGAHSDAVEARKLLDRLK
jgi:hypothetical protein